MILDQMVDVLVDFVERMYEMYRVGNLSHSDYYKLTYNKIHFLENHMSEIKVIELKSRCLSVLTNNYYNIINSDIILH